jgi:hypothetical protein
MSLFLVSCSKSAYYAFQDNSTYSYCTIEVTKKKEVIYRASSLNYFNKSCFVYISSLNDNYYKNINNDTIGLENPHLEMFYIGTEYPIKYKFELVRNGNPELNKLYISFIKVKNDTIKTQYYLNNLVKETSLQKAGVKWFPPYLIKVDKIDYSKFQKKFNI